MKSANDADKDGFVPTQRNLFVEFNLNCLRALEQRGVVLNGWGECEEKSASNMSKHNERRDGERVHQPSCISLYVTVSLNSLICVIQACFKLCLR